MGHPTMKLLGFPMALQFESSATGTILYRKDQVGPALPVTVAERDAYVGWMGWMVVLCALLYFVGIILMSVLADRFIESDSNSVGAVGAMAIGLAALASLYLFLRWASHAPARAFAGRSAVEPARTRKQVFGKRMAKMSYARIAVVSTGLAVFLLFGTAGDVEIMWLAVGLPAAVGIGMAIWKWRIETE